MPFLPFKLAPSFDLSITIHFVPCLDVPHLRRHELVSPLDIVLGKGLILAALCVYRLSEERLWPVDERKSPRSVYEAAENEPTCRILAMVLFARGQQVIDCLIK